MDSSVLAKNPLVSEEDLPAISSTVEAIALILSTALSASGSSVLLSDSANLWASPSVLSRIDREEPEAGRQLLKGSNFLRQFSSC